MSKVRNTGIITAKRDYWYIYYTMLPQQNVTDTPFHFQGDRMSLNLSIEFEPSMMFFLPKIILPVLLKNYWYFS